MNFLKKLFFEAEAPLFSLELLDSAAFAMDLRSGACRFNLQAEGHISSEALQLPAASGKLMRLRYRYSSGSGNAMCEVVASLLGNYVMISAKLPDGEPHSLKLDGKALRLLSRGTIPEVHVPIISRFTPRKLSMSQRLLGFICTLQENIDAERS